VSVIASINTNSSVSIVARKSAGINEPTDLKGKKLALSPGTSAEIYAMDFIDKYNLSDDIEVVKMQANTISAAIISKSVDAISSWGPYLYNAQETLGEDSICFRGTDVYDMFLGVNNGYTNRNKDIIVRFLKAIMKAATFAKDNASEAQKIVAKILNLDLEIVKGIWEFHDFKVELNVDNLSRVIDIAEHYKGDNANSGKPFPEYSDYFDYSLMEEMN